MRDSNLESFNYESRILQLSHLFFINNSLKQFKNSRHIVKLSYNLKKWRTFKLGYNLNIAAIL